MKTALTPHPLYFLTAKTEGQEREASLAAIKDERTGERFACLFVSAQDAEEFMVANDLTFDAWTISEARRPYFVLGYCDDAQREGIYKFVINPPPVIHGVWRTLFVKQLRTWGRKAKKPLLAWASYEVQTREAEK